MATQFRPTSPHLEIWRFTLTMTLSIVHRVLGIGLYVGTLLLVVWLGAAALGDDVLAPVNAFFGHWLIQIALFLYTLTLFHHVTGGIRYLIWDTGTGFDARSRDLYSIISIIASVAATLVVWALFVWF